MLTHEEQVAFLMSANNVRKAAECHLRANRDKQSVIKFVSNLQHGVSRVIQTAVEQGVKIACEAGCNHCCSARVEAIAPEIFRIARELESRPADELNHYVQRLTMHVAMPSEAAAWAHRTQCPFLSNDLCSIYDVRPSRCRKAHSLDVTKCRANAPEIPQDLGTVLGVEALVKGTSDAYSSLGYDASSHELGRSVLIALSDPSAESRWYSGESVFV
jgi:Fe-S-cluster containining protein